MIADITQRKGFDIRYLQVGPTDIPYEFKRSTRARRMRITIRPQGVVVVAPFFVAERTVTRFVESKKQWVFKKTEQLRRQSFEIAPLRFVSGSKIPYRGKRIRLKVEPWATDTINVCFRHGFIVRVPFHERTADGNGSIKEAIETWMRKRVATDAESFVESHGRRHGLNPLGIRVKDQKHLWGSCGKNGMIHLNWRLIFAPKPILEYVVAHELCHLRQRNHSARFWSLMQEVMPDYDSRRQWLRKNEHELFRLWPRDEKRRRA